MIAVKVTRCWKDRFPKGWVFWRVRGAVPVDFDQMFTDEIAHLFAGQDA